jgi:hypothetical protein
VDFLLSLLENKHVECPNILKEHKVDNSILLKATITTRIHCFTTGHVKDETLEETSALTY